MESMDRIGFPRYEMDEDGQIYSIRFVKEGTRTRPRPLKYHVNNGYVGVNLIDFEGITTKHLVARIVGFMFIPRENENDNSILHRDGDRMNYHPSNLLWRPLWLVRSYKNGWKQWPVDSYRPVVEIETGRVFRNPTLAAQHYGCLVTDLVNNIFDREYGLEHPPTPYPCLTNWAWYEKE